MIPKVNNKFSSEFLYSRINAIFPILLCIYLAYLLWPAFMDETSLIRTDQPMWTSFTHLLKHEIFPDQKWFWGIITDRENAGLSMGHSYSLNIILLWILSHVFNPATSVKIILFISLLSLTISVYFVSSKLTDPLLAIIPALLIIPIIFPLAARGMAYSHLSLSFALFFWLSSLKFLKTFGSKDWLISVLLVTFAVYAHPVGSITCMAIWAALIFSTVINKSHKPLRKVTLLYFFIPFLSIILAAPQTYSLFFTGSRKISQSKQYSQSNEVIQRNSLKVDGPKKRPTLSRSLNFDTYLQEYGIKGKIFILFFSVVGLVAIIKKENDLKLPLLAIYLTGFLLASRLLILFPVQISFFQILTKYYWRFELLLKIVFVILAGVGLKFFYDYFFLTCDKRKKMSVPAKVFFLFVLVLAFFICGRNLNKNRIWSEKHLVTFEKFENKRDVEALWHWLSNNVNAEEYRVYFEDTWLSYPLNIKLDRRHIDLLNSEVYNHVLALTSIATDIKQIGGWSGFSSSFGQRYNQGKGGRLFGQKSVKDISEELVANNLKSLNCKYIVVHSEEIIDLLENISILQKSAIIGDFHIFEYSDMVPAWAYKVESQESSTLIKRSPTHYILMSNGNSNDRIQISLAYHNYWKAYYNNAEIPIINHKALMQIRLPDKGSQVIELKYIIDKKEPIIFLSLGLVCLLYCIRFIKKWKIFDSY